MNHICKYCNNTCIKKGVRNFVQKYLCKICNKYQQKAYKYRKYTELEKKDIINLTKEGACISSISRIILRSKSSIQREIYKAGNLVYKPLYNENNEEYELDEMTLMIAGKKDIYLIYAINRRTRQVVDFFIGNRTKENIKRVVDSVLCYFPKTVYTDRLNSYPSLIPSAIHKPGRRLTNRIERKNLTFRTSVKRLSKCTLCFTRKIELLTATMKLICWA
ncbi:MAG: IS1 family transposase [Bacteroidetes bacterium]|nr:IS1 family transposase [Bacteroidota bacterium]